MQWLGWPLRSTVGLQEHFTRQGVVAVVSQVLAVGSMGLRAAAVMAHLVSSRMSLAERDLRKSAGIFNGVGAVEETIVATVTNRWKAEVVQVLRTVAEATLQLAAEAGDEVHGLRGAGVEQALRRREVALHRAHGVGGGGGHVLHKARGLRDDGDVVAGDGARDAADEVEHLPAGGG